MLDRRDVVGQHVEERHDGAGKLEQQRRRPHDRDEQPAQRPERGQAPLPGDEPRPHEHAGGQDGEVDDRERQRSEEPEGPDREQQHGVQHDRRDQAAQHELRDRAERAPADDPDEHRTRPDIHGGREEDGDGRGQGRPELRDDAADRATDREGHAAALEQHQADRQPGEPDQVDEHQRSILAAPFGKEGRRRFGGLAQVRGTAKQGRDVDRKLSVWRAPMVASHAGCTSGWCRGLSPVPKEVSKMSRLHDAPARPGRLRLRRRRLRSGRRASGAGFIAPTVWRSTTFIRRGRCVRACIARGASRERPSTSLASPASPPRRRTRRAASARPLAATRCVRHARRHACTRHHTRPGPARSAAGPRRKEREPSLRTTREGEPRTRPRSAAQVRGCVASRVRPSNLRHDAAAPQLPGARARPASSGMSVPRRRRPRTSSRPRGGSG